MPNEKYTYGQKELGLDKLEKPTTEKEKAVYESKQDAADLIDQMHKIHESTTYQEQKSIAATAIRRIKSANNWVNQVITWQPPKKE